ncbi:uncharacterized protein [Rutidosis leptorrhynchoides]|uniref:uncharacterized protein n=1 Tax=Rutidosis leptorrhynchoides TaxID=125765 RepID=UPI003A9A0038
MEDFNVSLNLDDSTIGSSNITIAMREFRECVEHMRMTDVTHSGLHFIWNQHPNSLYGTLKKIDRVIANDIFINDFIDAYAIFLPYRISDHCPAVLKIPSTSVMRTKPFKFSNFIVYKEGFDDIVLKGWRRVLVGYNMFQVVKKLLDLKKHLRRLMWQHGNLHSRVVKLKVELDEAQNNLDKNPFSVDTREDQCTLLRAYNDAVLDEERHLKRKRKLNGFPSKAVGMVRPVSANEVKAAMYDIGNNKSPGPDGFTSEFFKSLWEIIGDEVTLAIQDFFKIGQLLMEINHTLGILGSYFDPLCLPPSDDPLDYEMRHYVSISCINEALDQFKSWSGLILSIPKSKAYFANVSQILKNQILAILPFEEGTLPNTFWVRRVYAHKLVGRNFWYIDVPSNASWSWPKILWVWEEVKGRFFHSIRNGQHTSAWFDKWCDTGPLSLFITPRIIHQAGFDMYTTVSDIVHNNTWCWPAQWEVWFPQLANINPPIFSNEKDVILWEDNSGHTREFSIRAVWEHVRHRADEVTWVSVVWFSLSIPKHAFVMWLLMNEKLKTQDKVK